MADELGLDEFDPSRAVPLSQDTAPPASTPQAAAPAASNELSIDEFNPARAVPVKQVADTEDQVSRRRAQELNAPTFAGNLGEAALSGTMGLARGAVESLPGGAGFQSGFEQGMQQGKDIAAPIRRTLEPAINAAAQNPAQAIPGAAEALAAGTVGLGSEGASGIYGIARGAWSAATGGEFMDGFAKGLEQGRSWAAPVKNILNPETEVGKQALASLGAAFTGPQEVSGDKVFDTLQSSPNPEVRALAPSAGAITQALVAYLELGAPGARMPKGSVDRGTPGVPSTKVYPEQGPGGPGGPIYEGEVTGRTVSDSPFAAEDARLQGPPPPALPGPKTDFPTATAARTIPLGENNIMPGPTEAPAVHPADAIYAAREATARERTASEIPLDPANPMEAIRAIASAPLAKAGGSISELPPGIDTTAHTNLAGDIAAGMLHAQHLERLGEQMPDSAPLIQRQADGLRQTLRQQIADYADQNGPDAAAHLRDLAAQTFHYMKNDYPVQDLPVSTAREQAPGVNDAIRQPSAEGQVSRAGEGRQDQSEGGGGMGQGQQGPEAASPRPPTGDRGQRSFVPPVSSVPVGANLPPLSNDHAVEKAPEPSITSDADKAAHAAAASPLNERPAPTRYQALAENYKMGEPVSFGNGALKFKAEVPAGGERVDAANVPPKWRSLMVGYHYGKDITRAPGKTESIKGADGAEPDWFVKQGTPSDSNAKVFVVNQINQKTGKFDEHKFFLGPRDEAEARAAYLAHYPRGWKVGSIVQTTLHGYNTWKRFGDTTKPFGPSKVIAKGNAPAPGEPSVLAQAAAAQPAIKKTEYPVVQRTIHNNIERGPLRHPVSSLPAETRGAFSDEMPRQLAKDQPDFRVMTPAEHEVVAAMVRDLDKKGLPAEIMAASGVLHAFPNTYSHDAHIAAYPDGSGHPGIRENVLEAAANGELNAHKTLVSTWTHEMAHLLVNSGGMLGLRAATDHSAAFELKGKGGSRIFTGDVGAEMQDAYYSGTPIATFLKYPFRMLDDAQRMPDKSLKEELFAQIFSIGYNHPDWLEPYPATNALFQQIKDGLNGIDKSAGAEEIARQARAAVQGPVRLYTNGAHEQPAVGRGGDQGAAYVPRRWPPAPTFRYSRSVEEGQRTRDQDITSRAVTLRETGARPLGRSASVEDVARHFDEQARGVKDYDDAAATRRAVGQAIAELRFQLRQEKTGLDWYSGDINEAYRITQRTTPQLSQEVQRQLLSVIAAVISPQTKAHTNWFDAATAHHTFTQTGEIPPVKESGANWGTYGIVKPSAQLNNMIGDMGLEQAVEWLLTPHPISELKDMRRRYGVYKDPGDIPGKATDLRLGVEMFGPKVGPFALNVNGISTRVTVDTWAVRTLRRWFGRLLGGTRDGETQAPTQVEMRKMTDIVTRVAAEEGLEPSQVQAVLWYFEQQLYTQLGAASPSYSFADGARMFAEANGDFEHGREDNAGGGDVAQAEAGHGQEAHPDDFREDPESAVQKDGWAFVTATRESHLQDASADNDALEAYLDARGIPYQKIGGVYGGVDQGRSFLIFAPEARALEIGKRFGQESIATNRGLVYTDGRVEPWDFSKTEVGPAAASGDHTTLPDGTAISLKLAGPTIKASRALGDELAGDGRGFTDFFTQASQGKRAPNGQTYAPTIDISSVAPFSREYVKHRGNFDDHIATSIPGFREVQQAVGDAIVKTYDNGANLLDIAASEGAFNKAITQQSGGKIRTVALDPNEQMAKFFKEHSTVDNAHYDVSAFSGAEDEGKTLWTEPSGTEIKGFQPDRLFDVVHEAMGFQFISNTRNAQFARVKELMKPDGIALFEEKVKEDTPEWRANEAKKDAYKARYYTPEQMKAKAAEVLQKGEAAVKEADSKAEQNVVGMNDLMTTTPEFEQALRNNWSNVYQYWDSGNFKGYVASDSPLALHRFLSNLTDLNSEYSTVETPHRVEGEPAHAQAPKALRAIEDQIKRATDLVNCLTS